MKLDPLAQSIAKIGRREAYRHALNRYRHWVEAVARCYADQRATGDPPYLWHPGPLAKCRHAEAECSKAFEIVVSVLDEYAAEQMASDYAEKVIRYEESVRTPEEDQNA